MKCVKLLGSDLTYKYIASSLFSRGIRTSDACLQQNHYDALEISPKATQADVKSAYYKLSKVYHPDRNKNSEEAHHKFRAISEAYEVLGNVRLRRLYDKGVHHISANSRPQPAYEEPEDDPTTRFYRSREHRHKPPPPTGRTPIYDFDEWTKAHYGATFQKDRMRRKHTEYKRVAEVEDSNNAKRDRFLIGMGAALIIMFYIVSEFGNADKVTYQRGVNEIPSDLNRK